MIVGLVGCAAAKLQRPAPARELYTSQLFRKSAAYVEAYADRWYVLSAKHHLVAPETVLAPYDVKLGANSRSSPPIHAWAMIVVEQLRAELAEVSEPITLLVLAGEQYRTFLVHLAEPTWDVQVPMRGLGIGQQLGWLTTRQKEAA